ncbi:hypothetical protein [Humisphaera borealis]|uniref:DUF1559 domain-containing protein n=1 Tax=Humisphaera borealis TaxID=2807512 RepID=A0A7M2X139_9BACT|nr:hypothetical protein [Humisphaera borealis]QOV91389.1 hypothetical protein IPV69_08560 [Humisphaera borealis]
MIRSTSHRAFALILLATNLLPLPANAQADAAKPEGFAAHFHRDDTSVIVVEDPLPHLRTLLNSQTLKKVLTDGALGKLLARSGDAPDPAEGWQWVNNNRRWIPQQLAIGMSDNGIGDLDHLLRLLTAFELLQAVDVGNKDDAKFRAEAGLLRKTIAEELPLTQLPRMRVYVRFRDAEDAGALLELARLQVNDLPKDDIPPGVSFEAKGNALTARLVLADVLRAKNIDVEELLTDIDVVHADDGADAIRKAVNAVQSFKAEITLEQVGSGLLLTVGPTTAGGPAGLPADFVNLPDAVGKPDATTLLWGRWTATRLKSAAAAWLTTHEKWKASYAYSLAGDTALGGEPVIDALHDLALRIRKFADAGSMRIWIDDKSAAMHLAMQEEPKPAAADLAGSALARLLPADVDGFSVSTDTSLGEVVSDWVQQVEGRMASQTLKADLRGNDADLAHKVEQNYYTHFAGLRELIHRTALDKFEPGYAMLFGTKGKVDRLEASFELNARPQRVSGRDLPTPEMAIIGRPKGGEAAMREHVEKVYSAMIRGIRSSSRPDALANQPLPPVDAKAVMVDHGLGVPTWTFEAASLAKASGEAKLRVDIKGDLQPHFFFADGMVVFSSSPRLSKSILEAQSGKAKRLTLPEDGDGPLITIGRQTGESFATTIEHLKAWYLVLTNNADAGDEHRDAAGAFDAIAALSRTITKIEWTTVQPTGERRQITEGVLIFGDGRDGK